MYYSVAYRLLKINIGQCLVSVSVAVTCLLYLSFERQLTKRQIGSTFQGESLELQSAHFYIPLVN
jgi:hypothetical protein